MWYAADTPVMPDPIMQTSASWVRAPSLPTFASGLASGVSIQNDLVGFGTGSGAGLLSTGRSSMTWCSARTFRGMGKEDMTSTPIASLRTITRIGACWVRIIPNSQRVEIT